MSPRSRDRRLAQAAGLAAAVLAIELVAALLAHSVALLADAGHVGVDVLALAFAAVAAHQAARPPTGRQTYGYHRVGVLVALANAVLLLVVVGGVAVLAVARLEHPGRPVAGIMLAAACLGILANGVSAVWLRGDGSLNVRAALLHAGADVAAGLAVVVAALAILATGWRQADPVLSLAISALIAVMAVRLVREVVQVLLESVPPGVALLDVERLILATPEVVAVHDLHIWALTAEHRALSCHLTVADQSLPDAEHLVQGLSDRLCDRFQLRHTTIQVEACHPCPPGLCAGEGVAHHNHPHQVAQLAGAGPPRPRS
ncbi:MAG TPA: cation diffusion facilitator family transporter [Candidatus Micrarchaeia archaeon]|nr:cation diffusion facilitator family transporter [Candidatus Micrarchaeia archaeon]